MPIIAKQITDKEIKRFNKSGWYAVGGVSGLLLQLRQTNSASQTFSRSWILRIRAGGKRQLIGLGSYPQVSLAEARDKGRLLSNKIRDGFDVKSDKKRVKSALLASQSASKTFIECSEAYLEAHSKDYSNDKHRDQWRSTLETYAYPLIGKLLVNDITMRNILDVMLQETEKKEKAVKKVQRGKFWFIKTETAKRLLGRIKSILDFAIVNEYRKGTNPAQWTGYLDTQLASPRKISKVEHFPSLRYQEIGDFMPKLRSNGSISSQALEFLILTAVRSGSVRNAEWSEIDFHRKIWTIPAEHTKARKEHRVPLSAEAIKVLKCVPQIEGCSIIFPSPRGKPLSDMALSALMNGMRERGIIDSDAVPHGFRSTFRVWATELTNYPEDLRKIASMHTVSDAVLKAYERSDLIEKRRIMMSEWAKFIYKPSVKVENNVTTLRRAN